MRTKVCIVFGTRPEAIKMAMVVRVLKENPKFDVHVCVTGQHREMLSQVLDIFEITPDTDLQIMKPGQDLTDITSNILIGLRQVFRDLAPDIVFVHGDTTTAFSASLAAFYEKIRVFHVEAGLRTGDIYAPWPEEMNRKLVGSIASFHFAPTTSARQHLMNEGVDPGKIRVTGNTVIDSLLWVREKIDQTEHLRLHYEKEYHYLKDQSPLLLVTGHRRENFGEGFLNICLALKEIAHKKPELTIIYPVHPNPNVKGPVETLLKDQMNIRLIDPLDYTSFVYLLSRSTIVLTDSGGIQEEAPSFGKPVLVMRDVTERPEAVEQGVVKLVGTNRQLIIDSVILLLDNHEAYRKMSEVTNPYGDGKASERILQSLLDYTDD